jgi:hypothetical protein
VSAASLYLTEALVSITAIREALAAGDEVGALQLAEDAEIATRDRIADCRRLELAEIEERKLAGLVMLAYEARGTARFDAALAAIAEWHERLPVSRFLRWQQAEAAAREERNARLLELLRATNPDRPVERTAA